jgi:hypothetical protein
MRRIGQGIQNQGNRSQAGTAREGRENGGEAGSGLLGGRLGGLGLLFFGGDFLAFDVARAPFSFYQFIVLSSHNSLLCSCKVLTL